MNCPAPSSLQCGVPSERMNGGPSVPGVTPRAGMRCPVGVIFCAKGATAYQRRVRPWVFPIPGGGGGMKARPTRCGVPSERMNGGPSVPGVTPRAGMHTPLWGDPMRQRRYRIPAKGNALERVQPWEWDFGYGCVLKERRIDRAGVGDAMICGVLSERGNDIPHLPRALPWAGMRGPVGAGIDATIGGVPSERGNDIPHLPRALPWAGMRGPVGAGIDATIGGVLSKRGNDIPHLPRALPWAGMRGPVGAGINATIGGVPSERGKGWYAAPLWDDPCDRVVGTRIE